MTNINDISNEHLNAYLDNELDSDERGEVMAALETDTALAKRLCELRNVKELTQFAYSIPPTSRQEKSRWKFGKQYSAMAVAATLLLTVGTAVGWLAHDRMDVSLVQGSEHKLLSDRGIASLPLEAEEKRVILHVDSAEPARLTAALDSAEDLLLAAATGGYPFELEIITNGGGLNLIRVDKTVYADRITKLSKKYDNFSILACSRAIKRLEDKGIKVKLIPEAEIAPSALEQIITRLKQGWIYIKV
ncbi:MAG TPA: hypothetical protein ENG90_11765 [Gammaproteobacteria bacterium]|nr:DsrE/DsrF-like family protein [bacterium BMS3Abin11]GMT39591.1 MAG: hypothetical protein IEMM0001_0326 [bacterium]HDH08260.1 hypothetical protein [Gammaproteobacteria bacterium]HDH17128.1 hypothetical protein [Gammaproteobacteria bacterium]